MSSNIKIALVVIVLGVIVAVSMYFYMSGDSYSLLKEAERLYAEGDIYGANDKAGEALQDDPTNRKAIDLKAKYYKEVQDDINYKKAVEEYRAGVNEMNRQNFQEAAIRLYKALDHIDNISENARPYAQAQELHKEVVAQYNLLDSKLTEYYYNNALRAYGTEDYARAYEYLRQAPKETAQVIELRSNIAYDLGMKRHQEIMINPSGYPLSYYNDAIYWFRQVSSSSPHYKQAQDAIGTLTENMPKK